MVKKRFNEKEIKGDIMFNKKKKDSGILEYPVMQPPDFFDNIERIAISFDPLFKSTSGIEDKALLITVFEKCIDFCIEVEKSKIRSFKENSEPIDDWWKRNY